MSTALKPNSTTGSELATEKVRPFPKQPARPMPERIRPELNLEKWAIWQPAKSKNQPVERKLRREITLDDGKRITAEVEVGYTNKGALTTEDQKTYYALVKHWEDTGRSDRPVYFSLKRLSKLLNKKWGTNVIEALTHSLTRLRITPFIWTNSYEDSDTKKVVEVLEPFNILADLKIVRSRVDGHVTKQAGYFRFNEFIVRNLQANLTKPLLFETVIGFRSEIAQILYVYLDLILYEKTIFERRTRELFEELGLQGKAYINPSKRKQVLEPALQELTGAPLTSGRIVSATLERTKDESDYKIVIRKGKLIALPKINHYQDEPAEAAADQDQPEGREATPTAQAESPAPVKGQLARQAEELITYFYEVFFNGKNFIIGVKLEGQAISLITQYGLERAKYIVDFAKREAPKTNFNIQTFGGVIGYACRAIADLERRKLQQQEAARLKEKAAELAAQEHQEEEVRAGIYAYLDQLPVEDYLALITKVGPRPEDQKWLSQCSEEARQSYYRRLLMIRIRRQQLDDNKQGQSRSIVEVIEQISNPSQESNAK